MGDAHTAEDTEIMDGQLTDCGEGSQSPKAYPTNADRLN